RCQRFPCHKVEARHEPAQNSGRLIAEFGKPVSFLAKSGGSWILLMVPISLQATANCASSCYRDGEIESKSSTVHSASLKLPSASHQARTTGLPVASETIRL